MTECNLLCLTISFNFIPVRLIASSRNSSFLLLCNIPFYEYTTIYLPILLIVADLRLLQIPWHSSHWKMEGSVSPWTRLVCDCVDQQYGGSELKLLSGVAFKRFGSSSFLSLGAQNHYIRRLTILKALCFMKAHVKWLRVETESFGDFPGGPVVKNSPSNAGDAGSILIRDWTKIPHALGQLRLHNRTREAQEAMKTQGSQKRKREFPCQSPYVQIIPLRLQWS